MSYKRTMAQAEQIGPLLFTISMYIMLQASHYISHYSCSYNVHCGVMYGLCFISGCRTIFGEIF